ncbi:MAG TPA: hypothetical protein VGG58_02690, partial [Candidatus Acidoferrum sp.]
MKITKLSFLGWSVVLAFLFWGLVRAARAQGPAADGETSNALNPDLHPLKPGGAAPRNSTAPKNEDAGWPNYGNDPGGTRYSTATQITR